MSYNKSYAREMTVSASPSAAYRALTEGIDQWWTTTSNPITSAGDAVAFSFKPTFWKMRVRQMVPEKLIELVCIEAHHVHAGLPASIREEWLGTVLRWRIEPQAGGTRIVFEHEGLVPALNCYDICEAGWDHFFLNSLKSYLDTGKGIPGEIGA